MSASFGARSPRIIRSLYERDGRRCYLCGHTVDPQVATIDHVQPTAHGGAHEPRNWRLTHKACNRAKADLSVDEFRSLVQRLHSHLFGTVGGAS